MLQNWYCDIVKHFSNDLYRQGIIEEVTLSNS